MKPGSKAAGIEDLVNKLKIDTTPDLTTVRTAPTTCTTDDSESSPYFGSASSAESIDTIPRSSYESVLFRTPGEKAICSFEDLGISPGSLELTFKDAEERIVQDDILNESFVEPNGEFHRCIVFLYARGFFLGNDPRGARCKDQTVSRS